MSWWSIFQRAFYSHTLANSGLIWFLGGLLRINIYLRSRGWTNFGPWLWWWFMGHSGLLLALYVVFTRSTIVVISCVLNAYLWSPNTTWNWKRSAACEFLPTVSVHFSWVFKRRTPSVCYCLNWSNRGFLYTGVEDFFPPIFLSSLLEASLVWM